MPNVPPKGLFGSSAGGAGLSAVDLVATLVGETTPRNVLEVWAAGTDQVPQLVWIRDAESPSAATIAYASPNVNVSWTALDPLRSDSYEVRRPDGSLVGTAGQNDTALTDTAPKALNGAYTIAGVIGGVADATPRTSNSLNLTTAPQTPAAAWSSPNVNVTWTAPAWGAPHFYHVYRNGVYQAQVSGASLLWQDTNPPRGTQPTYTIYAVLSGTLTAGATTAAVNVPANVPTSVALAAVGNANLRLTWAAPAGTITGYEVERYVSSWAAHATYGTGTLSSDWSTQLAGYMRVRALSAGGASDWVQAGSVQPNPPTTQGLTLYATGGIRFVDFTGPVDAGGPPGGYYHEVQQYIVGVNVWEKRYGWTYWLTVPAHIGWGATGDNTIYARVRSVQYSDLSKVSDWTQVGPIS